MSDRIVARLTAEDLIARAEEEERFVREALLKYHQSEYLKAERRRLWKGIAIAVGITWGIGMVVWWMLR